MRMKTMKCWLAAVLALSFAVGSTFAADEDLFDRAPWFGTLGLSYYHLEGDVEAEPGFGLQGKLGYSFNAWWDLEGGLYYMPSLSDVV